MRRERLQIVGAVASGLLFGSGLLLSGMTRPSKVLGFLTISADWDPSLLFVMMGAIAVHALGYRLVVQRGAPLADDRFWLPKQTLIDARLVAGAAIFGVGWGLSGYCPGPAVVSLASGSLPLIVFLIALLLGSVLSKRP